MRFVRFIVNVLIGIDAEGVFMKDLGLIVIKIICVRKFNYAMYSIRFE